MAQDKVEQHRHYITMAYMFMFLALFTIVTGLIAYLLAAKVAHSSQAEVWIQAHGIWVMRSVILFMVMGVFAGLWFIPLAFYAWNDMLWVTGCTVAGVIFAFIAWMYFLNCFIQGLSKYFKKKAVF
ncbi:hypothetical protein ACX1N5_14560 [Acinetobacter sp. ANC 4636]|uniref:hypothetical protein n=1 Tax=Acinetobacter sp. ANC 3789 TaxID=1217714 RepID=UPI0002CFEDA3|nr:hypothetical protein [Acinetobacter sp. ANC 3789]ENU79198.1 hypothetical protein F975_02972 [Acinetobacter sp. ANC 3789]